MRNSRRAVKVTFDTETRGLFGKIVLCGWYDGKQMHYCDASEFISQLDNFAQANDADVYAYAHNLDFDIAKLYKYGKTFEIDFSSKSIIIDKKFCRAHIKGTNVYLCDSLKLFPSSLEQLTKDFELTAGKKDIDYKAMGYESKTDFFEHVEADNPIFREYFEYDCKALYELLEKGIAISELTEEEFIKCPTAPALAMKIFKTKYPEQYKTITDNHNPLFVENFFRNAYVGARTEVFRPLLQGQGYHYDVNSLYPYVMLVNDFPIGHYDVVYDNIESNYIYESIKNNEGVFTNAIFWADVEQPDTYLPVLPYHAKDRLYFPVGSFSGYWTDVELFEAERQGAIINVKSCVVWKRKAPVFKDFITELMKGKMESTGAKRNFYKLIQNSFYGKWGMNRIRETYYEWSEAKEKELKEKGIPYIITRLSKNLEIICCNVSAKHIEYIHPEISTYITSYARLVLYKALRAQVDAGANIYYCDTDSMVTDRPLPADMVDDKIYGKWKLERTINEGIFLQPKFYAEQVSDGKYELKSKGLLKQYRETLSYESYKDLYEKAKRGEEVMLYANLPERRKFLMSLIKHLDVDEPVKVSKSIYFARSQKRIVDYEANNTRSIEITNAEWAERKGLINYFIERWEKSNKMSSCRMLLKTWLGYSLDMSKLPKKVKMAISRIEKINPKEYNNIMNMYKKEGLTQ